MAGDDTTYAVSNRNPNELDWIGEDQQGTTWLLSLGDTQVVQPNSTVTVDSRRIVSIYAPSSPPDSGALIWQSTEPATLTKSGLLYGSGYHDQKLMTVVFSMILLTEENPDTEVVEKHITMLTMENDPDDVGVMAGQEGG